MTSRGIQYDGLIVCISCHGDNDGIITSDLRRITTEILVRAISRYHPKVLEIPRILILNTRYG